MVFVVFQPVAKVFPLDHLLCTVYDGNGQMHRKSFPVNRVFCAQLQKFSPLTVLPYTVQSCQILCINNCYIRVPQYLSNL